MTQKIHTMKLLALYQVDEKERREDHLLEYDGIALLSNRAITELLQSDVNTLRETSLWHKPNQTILYAVERGIKMTAFPRDDG